jgi:RNA polymerase sigma factor (sigma-70 family)
MGVWPPSDEALLSGFASGDPEAAVAFVRRFQGRVYGVAFTIVGDASLAEDVAQETFVRAWRHAGTFDARRGRVSTWLLAIARNRAIDKARMNEPLRLDPEALLSRLNEPARYDGAETFADREHIRSLLVELPPDQRRALVLATYFGRTAKEISELDGVPLGTVKTRIRTAMLRLRRQLELSDEAA